MKKSTYSLLIKVADFIYVLVLCLCKKKKKKLSIKFDEIEGKLNNGAQELKISYCINKIK